MKSYIPLWAAPRLPRAVKFAGTTGNIDEEGVLLLVEAWSSTGGMQRHLRSKDFRLALALMDLSARPPDFKTHKVEDTSALNAVRVDPGNQRQRLSA